MALALLEADEGSGFRYDLGRNRYYRYVLGRGRVRREGGIEVIEDAVFESEMVGPVPEEQLGRGRLTIDTSRTNSESRLLQLWSFRTPERKGPAVSSIVDLGGTPSVADHAELPAVTFARVDTMPATVRALDTVPFRYREAQFSNAMFLDVLGNLLTGILPKVAPIIGSLFGGGGSAATAGSGAATGAAAPGGPLNELMKLASNPETIKLVLDLIRQAQAGGAGAPTGTPLPKGASLGKRSTSTHALAMRRQTQGPLPRCREEYSETKFDPITLVAALPAIAPLLEKVLSPETVKAVLDAPTKHVGTIINGVLDFAKLGLQDSEKFREHLRALNPGVEDPGFNQLIATVTQSLAVGPRPLNYARVDSVRLDFMHAPPVPLLGRERIIYRHGQALAFPLTLETPQTIRQGTLQLEIKDAKSLAVHHQTRYRVEQVSSGPLLTVPALAEAESLRLTPNHDYLVCVALVWKNKDGQARGTSMQQEITLAGEYLFDRIDESSELIRLDDPERFRDYWHRIWEGEFEDGITRVELDAKYYYVLAPERFNHARIESRTHLTADEKTLSGRLKAGLELSPTALNRLLTELDPSAGELTDAEILAFSAPEFAERIQQCARYKAVLRARSGDHGSLWVYPEFKIQHITLQQATRTDDHGQVLELQRSEVRFPVPALLHFVGVRSE